MSRTDRVSGSPLLLLPVLFVLAAGCPRFEADGEYLCDVDAACPSGQSCDLTAKRCVPAATPDAGAPDAGESTDAGDVTDAGPTDPCADADYTFDVTRKLSVLFVVDDSGSMQPRQEQWSARAEPLATLLDDLAADWRIAFTTTDVEQTGLRGGLVPLPEGAFAVRHDDADRVAHLQTGFNRGTAGSGDERGLEALSLAFNPPMLQETLAALYGIDRSLLVAVLSDEDDASTLDLDVLKEDIERPGWDGLTGFFIVGPSTGCSDAFGEAQAGTRYGTFANRIFATRVSICAPDPLSALETTISVDLGRSVFRLPGDAPIQDPTKVLEVGGEGTIDRTVEVSYDDQRVAYFDLPGPAIGSKVCFFF